MHYELAHLLRRSGFDVSKTAKSGTFRVRVDGKTDVFFGRGFQSFDDYRMWSPKDDAYFYETPGPEDRRPLSADRLFLDHAAAKFGLDPVIAERFCGLGPRPRNC